MKLLAIEFTNEFIHVFQMDSQKGGAKIIKALHLEMPQNAYNNGMLINNDRAISDLLQVTLKEEKIKEKQVIVTVSSVDYLVENLSLPKEKEKVLKGMIEQELIKRRKLNANYIYDYSIIGDDPLKEGYVNVRAVLCPKALVNNYYDVIKKAGLNPYKLDLASHSMEFLAEKSNLKNSQEISILACINTNEVHFIYCGRNEEPYYRHAFLKKEEGLEESMFVLSANSQFNIGLDDGENTIEDIIENITRLTRFHSQRHPDLSINAIYLYGDYPELSTLCDRVQNAVGVPARNYNVVTAITNLAYRSSEPIQGCVNVIGTALAATDPNSKNYEFFEKLIESKQDKNANIFWMPTMIAIVLAAAVVVGYSAVNTKNKALEKENAEIEDFVYDPYLMDSYYMTQEYLEQIDSRHEYNSKGAKYIEVLDNKYRFESRILKLIDDNVIDGVKITGISFSDNKIRLSCTGQSKYSPADFSEKLDSLDEFSSVGYTGFTATPIDDDTTIYSFSVEVTLKNMYVEVDADE